MDWLEKTTDEQIKEEIVLGEIVKSMAKKYQVWIKENFPKLVWRWYLTLQIDGNYSNMCYRKC